MHAPALKQRQITPTLRQRQPTWVANHADFQLGRRPGWHAKGELPALGRGGAVGVPPACTQQKTQGMCKMRVREHHALQRSSYAPIQIMQKRGSARELHQVLTHAVPVLLAGLQALKKLVVDDGALRVTGRT